MNDKVLKAISYTDTQTGEVNIKKKMIDNMFTQDGGYRIPTNKTSWKRFPGVDFPADFTKVDRANMDILADHMWSNSNMLGYRGHGGIKAYDIPGIAKLLECSVRQAERFIKKMKSLGLIAQVKKEINDYVEIQYYLNPIYYCGVERINDTLYALFATEIGSIKKIVPEWAERLYAQKQSGLKQ